MIGSNVVQHEQTRRALVELRIEKPEFLVTQLALGSWPAKRPDDVALDCQNYPSTSSPRAANTGQTPRQHALLSGLGCFVP
jgi:hypothetical protein